MAETKVTQLLRELSEGNAAALDDLMPILYEELRRVARGQLRGERTDHTFDSTDLIHETYLRLREIRRVQWKDRNHFIAVAARVMRRVLTDDARTRRRIKRGGAGAHVSLAAAKDLPVTQAEGLLELDETLTRLEALNQRACRVVECRCFGGLSVEEAAQALHTSPATVKRAWVFSRAWLDRELGRRSA